MILWLIGPSGSGNSTVGPLLAERRNGRFVDLDRMIEERAGRSIPDIFRDEGEEEFRRLETELVEELVRTTPFREQLVAAAGGGAVVDPRNRDLMRSSGLRILLRVDAATAIDRLVFSEHRPLLQAENPTQVWQQLYDERITAYADHDIAVDATTNPDELLNAVTQQLHRFHASAWKIDARLEGQLSRIRAYRSPWSVVRAYRLATRLTRSFIITDAHLASHYSEFLKRLAGSKGRIFVVEPGEESKSFAVVEKIIEQLTAEGFDRSDFVLGFGGGVVTDLAGFVASIYMRGLHFIAMPTSLLAMVDASVGGKTAINAVGVRNLVGTFNQPERVLICPALLRTLPERELRSGLVESLKMGLIQSKVLSDLVADALPDILRGKIPEVIDEVIRLSVAVKLEVIGEDVRDNKRRGLLNFGHTFAHALEAAAPGVWTHGEAVAFGMIAAVEGARASESGFGSKRDEGWDRRVEEIIAGVLPLTNPHGRFPDLSVLLEKINQDKKRQSHIVRFVLPLGAAGTGWLIGGRLSEELMISGIRNARKRIEEYHGRNRS